MMISALACLASCDDEQPSESSSSPQKLSAPVVTLTGNVATWEANVNADKLEISIDGALSYLESTVTSKTLTNGQAFKIRAVGDGVNYSTSDWSNIVTYTESTPPASGTKLSTPAVSISASGLASWGAITNASSYIYKINGGAETATTALSVQLTDGQSISVKAVGDGTSYTDSDFSTPATYTAGTPTPPPASATKLSTPAVSISASGLASWGAVANASSYIYKINGGAETATTALSVQLTDGQSISVKAVGDGTSYTDSDFSAPATYTASTPTPPPPSGSTKAPEYLGILASSDVPSQSAPPSGIVIPLSSTRVSLEEALRDYFENPSNSLGDSAPSLSDYEIYSAIGETVYIQIWLDNPDQNTILSLKLNGVKYQSGGALQSFFIQNGNSYLNCVYVMVTIPAGSYEKIAYEVTEIEYVEGTNINQDGKAVLIDENKDTVEIGLPYEADMPSATVSNMAATTTGVSFNANVNDADNYVSTVGGWLRAIIFDRNNNILAQQKLVSGDNAVSFTNLSADTYYTVMILVLCDAHDGNGIYVHNITAEGVTTERVLTCDVTSEILQNNLTGKYYPNISVEAQLSDPSFSFTKVEVCDYQNNVLSTYNFNGSLDITEGIYNESEYVIKVYYKNAQNVEQSYRAFTYVNSLDTPWISTDLQYGLIDDAILGFDFGDGKYNLEDATIRIIDSKSKQYLANDALALIENPNLIEELEAQWQSLDRFDPDSNFDAVYSRWHKLKGSKEIIDDLYSEVTQPEWEAELAKGIYMYEFTLSEDDEFFKGAGNKYYVVLKDYQSKRFSDNSWEYTISVTSDMNTKDGVPRSSSQDGFFRISPALSDSDFLFVKSDEDYNELFTLDENNVVRLELMSRNDDGNESSRALGYVNQIALFKNYDEIVKVLWTQDAPNSEIDEGAWLSNIITTLKAGADINSVFPLGTLEPISFDLDDIDLSGIEAGNYRIGFCYKMFGKEYSSEHPYDIEVSGGIDYLVKAQLPVAGLEINDTPSDGYGEISVVIPSSLNGGSWSYYTIEIRDADEQPIGTYTQNEMWGVKLSAGYSARIKLTAGSYDYYLDGEFSEWFTCAPAQCATPTLSQSCENGEFIVSWEYIDGAEKYIYTVNGGAENETYDTGISGLTGGDVVKVKAVPMDGHGFLSSEFSEITIVDTRTKLDAPVVTYNSDYMYLQWEAVAGASYYNVYDASTGIMKRGGLTETKFYGVKSGGSYIIEAVPENLNEYASSRSEVVNT